MDRRTFLRMFGAGCAAVCSLPSMDALARAGQLPSVLWLRRGGESRRLQIEESRGYGQACYLLRDTAAGDRIAPASMGLLQTAAWMQAFLAVYGVHQPFNVHSGFRTKGTNTACGGAEASQHMLKGDGYFHAMDIHVEGISTEYLGRLAALASQGGVGFYRRKGFVHIDDANVRYWRG